MNKLISFMMRYIPRPLLIRASRFGTFFTRLFFRGDRYTCSVCGKSYRKFMPFGVETRPNVMCPNCLSLERHRHLTLYLLRQTDFFTKPHKMMHVAPQQCLYHLFRKSGNIDYLTADLVSPLADMHFDLHEIPLEDNLFDTVMCNHVLEHVEDDRHVMRELFRVIKPGGRAYIQVPQDIHLEETYEDKSITSPKERERHFRQKDHLRLFGRDFDRRMEEAAGFKVKTVTVQEVANAEEIDQYRLAPNELLYVAEKPMV